MTAATPHIAVFLTSDKIKCLEFIYHKLYTKLPLCMSRMLSQLHSLHWANFTAQRNCFYTGRSDNISWLFFKLHLTTTLLLTRQAPNQRAIGSKKKKKSHLASWHQNYDQWDEGSSTYHLSYQLRTIGFIKVHLFRDFHPRLMETYYVQEVWLLTLGSSVLVLPSPLRY